MFFEVNEILQLREQIKNKSHWIICKNFTKSASIDVTCNLSCKYSKISKKHFFWDFLNIELTQNTLPKLVNVFSISFITEEVHMNSYVTSKKCPTLINYFIFKVSSNFSNDRVFCLVYMSHPKCTFLSAMQSVHRDWLILHPIGLSVTLLTFISACLTSSYAVSSTSNTNLVSGRLQPS